MTRERLYNGAEYAGEQAQRDMASQIGMPTRRHECYRGWTCPTCGEKVEWVEREVGERTGNWYTDEGLDPCRCIREAYQPAYDAFVREHWAEAAAGEWVTNGIPPRYRDAAFASFVARPGTEEGITACKAYAEAFEIGKTAGGLFLFGPFGAGKTHLGVATARAIVERTLVRVVFKSTIGLMMEIKANFGRRRAPDDDTKDPVTMALEAELLILDDLGQEAPSEFNQGTMAGIIWHRYDQNLPTIITSNQADAQLKERLGGGLVSRLYEYCTPAVFTASDYRKQLAR